MKMRIFLRQVVPPFLVALALGAVATWLSDALFAAPLPAAAFIIGGAFGWGIWPFWHPRLEASWQATALTAIGGLFGWLLYTAIVQ